MAGRENTKSKILDAAELLFAEKGFADTSLRQITSRAEVNLASVNYHFGSKKELIQAVVGRYLNVLMPLIKQALSDLVEQNEDLSMEEVFSSFIEPLLALNRFRPQGTDTFLQLLGRGYTDKQGHLRWYLTQHHGDVLAHIVAAIGKANPELKPSDVFWRLHFTMGTLVFTMASTNALTEIAKADFAQEVDIEGVMRQVIPYISAGVNAGYDRDNN